MFEIAKPDGNRYKTQHVYLSSLWIYPTMWYCFWSTILKVWGMQIATSWFSYSKQLYKRGQRANLGIPKVAKDKHSYYILREKCSFFSRCTSGSTASSLRSTRPSAPPSPINHAGWHTRPSKFMSYIRFVCAMGAANAQFPMVQPTASQSIRVLTS